MRHINNLLVSLLSVPCISAYNNAATSLKPSTCSKHSAWRRSFMTNSDYDQEDNVRNNLSPWKGFNTPKSFGSSSSKYLETMGTHVMQPSWTGFRTAKTFGSTSSYLESLPYFIDDGSRDDKYYAVPIVVPAPVAYTEQNSPPMPPASATSSSNSKSYLDNLSAEAGKVSSSSASYLESISRSSSLRDSSNNLPWYRNVGNKMNSGVSRSLSYLDSVANNALSYLDNLSSSRSYDQQPPIDYYESSGPNTADIVVSEEYEDDVNARLELLLQQVSKAEEKLDVLASYASEKIGSITDDVDIGTAFSYDDYIRPGEEEYITAGEEDYMLSASEEDFVPSDDVDIDDDSNRLALLLAQLEEAEQKLDQLAQYTEDKIDSIYDKL